MKNLIDFNIPFTPFSFTDFISCFSSVYAFLENRKEDAEQFFFLFDTMCGRSSIRLRFDQQPTKMQNLIGEIPAEGYYNGTDSTTDFIFGFAGYEYQKYSKKSEYKEAIAASIHAGKPVLGRISSGNGRFHVIIGFDDDKLITTDYSQAQDPPVNAPTYDELEEIYIFGNKISPRFTFLDGLERIQQVIEQNKKDKIWDSFIEKMGGWLMYPSEDGFDKASTEEKISRMHTFTFTMQYAWNCHNFGEVFRNCKLDEMCDPVFSELWHSISDSCYCIDAFGHAINYLNSRIDWNTMHFAALPGISAMICMAIEKVKALDEKLLESINQAIKILKSNAN